MVIKYIVGRVCLEWLLSTLLVDVCLEWLLSTLFVECVRVVIK